jgi:hypothetical protein
MNRLAKTPSFILLGWLVCVFFSIPAESQFAQTITIPDPTQLQTAVLGDSSELVWSEALGKIESADASATVSAIEVAGPDGERVRGVKVFLENSASTDQIYLTDSLLSDFRDALQELEFTSQFDGECQARYRCIHGIARCRPSQPERQAYCPARYSTPDGEKGLILSTPRHSYLFPSVGPAQLDALISEAVQVLE